MSNFKYDAFISYRHGGVDQFVAENLHKQMETFKLPKNIMDKTNGKTKIQRVFRDQEELPLASNLGDPIQEALEDSEWLVVICSPRLRESRWCQTEIETFIKLHGREKVLAVLVEGEPSESFPEQLLYAEEEVTNPDGTTSIVKRPVEPLAADVRGESNSEILKAMKLEILRLLAPIFGVSFDDLRQRHRERRMRKIITVSLAAAAVSLAFGAVSTVMAVRINSQKKEIAEQNEVITASNVEIKAQAEEIQSQADELKKKNERLSEAQALSLAEKSANLLGEGDRIGAINAALESVSISEDASIPVTADTKYALETSTYAYFSGHRFVPMRQLVTNGIIEGISLAPDAQHLICTDAYDTLYLFDVQTGELMDSMSAVSHIATKEEDAYTFFDEDRFAYIDDKSQLKIYTVSEKKQETVELNSYVGQVKYVNGQYIWCECETGIYAIDKDSLKITDVVTIDKNFGTSLTISAVSRDENRIAYTLHNLSDYAQVHTVDVKTGEDTLLPTNENESVSDVKIKGNLVYVLTNDLGDLLSFKYMTRISCFNAKKGELKWDFVEKNVVGKSIRLASYEESNDMLMVSGSEVLLINQDDGTLTARLGIDDEPVENFGYTTSSMYALITREANLLAVMPEQQIVYQSNIFTGCVENVNIAKIGSGTICTAAHMSNKIIVYNMYKSDEAELVAEIPESVEVTEFRYNEAVEYAKMYEIADSDMVNRMIVDNDEGIAYASYYSDRFKIYDINQKKELASIEAGMTAEILYGKDKEGNYYIGDGSNAVVLDSEFNVVGYIEHMAGLNSDEGKIVVYGTSNNEYYSIPIMTFDEMVKYAREITSEGQN